ncbi:DUF6082 family protein [Streptomyces vastus]|uniref:Uncharacterized protein n=1 Tax=Streptomyces vastus TaxID=285451 RepID=A0ABN3R0M2_9ACTN
MGTGRPAQQRPWETDFGTGFARRLGALRAYGPDGSDSDWQRVGNVAPDVRGRLGVDRRLALAGVGASLVFQARESKANHEQGMRTAHTELMRMAMTDPSLMACWGRLDANNSEKARRQHLYLNLVVFPLEDDVRAWCAERGAPAAGRRQHLLGGSGS